MVKKGEFREDLFYRLEILRIDVPPLKERKEDIPILVKRFVKVASEEAKVPIKEFASESLQLLMDYDWPGNIRELYNFVMRAVVLSQSSDEILLNIPDRQKIGDVNFAYTSNKLIETWEDLVEERKKASDIASRQVEKQFVEHILKKYNNNITLASKQLGVDRTTLHKTIKRIKDGQV